MKDSKIDLAADFEMLRRSVQQVIDGKNDSITKLTQSLGRLQIQLHGLTVERDYKPDLNKALAALNKMGITLEGSPKAQTLLGKLLLAIRQEDPGELDMIKAISALSALYVTTDK